MLNSDVVRFETVTTWVTVAKAGVGVGVGVGVGPPVVVTVGFVDIVE